MGKFGKKKINTKKNKIKYASDGWQLQPKKSGKKRAQLPEYANIFYISHVEQLVLRCLSSVNITEYWTRIAFQTIFDASTHALVLCLKVNSKNVHFH